jgi:hypothetical protein
VLFVDDMDHSEPHFNLAIGARIFSNVPIDKYSSEIDTGIYATYMRFRNPSVSYDSRETEAQRFKSFITGVPCLYHRDHDKYNFFNIDSDHFVLVPSMGILTKYTKNRRFLRDDVSHMVHEISHGELIKSAGTSIDSIWHEVFATIIELEYLKETKKEDTYNSFIEAMWMFSKRSCTVVIESMCGKDHIQAYKEILRSDLA